MAETRTVMLVVDVDPDQPVGRAVLDAASAGRLLDELVVQVSFGDSRCVALPVVGVGLVSLPESG